MGQSPSSQERQQQGQQPRYIIGGGGTDHQIHGITGPTTTTNSSRNSHGNGSGSERGGWHQASEVGTATAAPGIIPSRPVPGAEAAAKPGRPPGLRRGAERDGGGGENSQDDGGHRHSSTQDASSCEDAYIDANAAGLSGDSTSHNNSNINYSNSRSYSDAVAAVMHNVSGSCGGDSCCSTLLNCGGCCAGLIPADAARAMRGSSNVGATIRMNFLDGACYSVWGALALPIVVGRQCGNATVGTAAAAAGIAQIAAAAVAGSLGAARPRQFFIRAGACCGALGAAVFLGTVLLISVDDGGGGGGSEESSSSSGSGSNQQTQLSSASLASSSSSPLLALGFIAAQSVWGLYSGFISTSTEALFADSVATGGRTGVYSIKWTAQTLCYLVGYAFALAMLWAMGNEWRLGSLKILMICGLLCHLLVLPGWRRLKDANALPAELPSSSPSVSAVAVVVDGEGEGEYGNGNGVSDAIVTVEGWPDNEEEEEEEEDASDERRFLSHSGGQRSDGHTAAVAATPPPPLSSTTTTATAGSPTAHHHHHQHQQQSAVPDTPPSQQSFFPISREAELHARVAAEVRRQQQRHNERQAARSNSVSRRLHAVLFTLCSWPAVPFLVCLVDLLVALGSGMTIMFFPRFFADDVGVAPVLVYGAYMTSTVLTAATTSLAKVVAERGGLGRIPTVIAVRTVGTAFMLLIGLIPVMVVMEGGGAEADGIGSSSGSSSSSDGNGASAAEAAVVMGLRPHAVLLFLSLFICRNACMNAVFGITRSLIMDAVPKESRAKWSAFESITSFSWAGSAMVGGYVADAHGYQVSFTVTAVFHLAAGLLLVPAAVGARRVERILRHENRGPRRSSSSSFSCSCSSSSSTSLRSARTALYAALVGCLLVVAGLATWHAARTGSARDSSP